MAGASIGDAAAALGGGKETINGITLALAQMTAKGKVSAQEMNQLAERGVPAWEMLARQIGVSVPEAMDMAEKGAIKAAQAVPAILDGMNQKFGGSMDQMSRTLTGQWSISGPDSARLDSHRPGAYSSIAESIAGFDAVLAALADGASGSANCLSRLKVSPSRSARLRRRLDLLCLRLVR